jgi:serine/threonine protein kinase
MAPEIIKQTGAGRAADIWSIGATIIEMSTGKPPWSEFSDNLAALFHVATSEKPPPIPPTLSIEGGDVLKRCMVFNASERYTACELLLMPFFSSMTNETMGLSTVSEAYS